MGVSSFMSEDDNKKFFTQQIRKADQALFDSFQSTRTDAGHANKRYIIYKHQPHDSINKLLSIKVIDINVDFTDGVRFIIENEETGDLEVIGHIPVKVFGFDVFMFTPPYQRFKFETFETSSGTPSHSLAFSISVCTASRSRNKKEGDIFCETPAELAKLYPNADTNI